MRLFLLTAITLLPVTAFAADPSLWIALSVQEDSGQHTEIRVPVDWIEGDVITIDDFDAVKGKVLAKANKLKVGTSAKVATLRQDDANIEVSVERVHVQKATPATEFYLTVKEDQKVTFDVALPISLLKGFADTGVDQLSLDAADDVDLAAIMKMMSEAAPFTLIDSHGEHGDITLGTK